MRPIKDQISYRSLVVTVYSNLSNHCWKKTPSRPEVWKRLDWKMRHDTEVEDSALMQRQSIIQSLQLMLIYECLDSAG